MNRDLIPEIPDDLELDESRLPTDRKRMVQQEPTDGSGEPTAEALRSEPFELQRQTSDSIEEITLNQDDIVPILSSMLSELQSISSTLREFIREMRT